jgi:hypothetical protein
LGQKENLEDKLDYIESKFGTDLMSFYEDFNTKLSSFTSVETLYEKFIKFNEATGETKRVLGELYPEYEQLFNLMGDNKNAYSMLDMSGLDVSTISEIVSILDSEGKNVVSTFKNMGDAYNLLSKTMSPQEAYATVFSQLASELNDAKNQTKIFNLSLRKDILQTAQSVDQLFNGMKGMQDTQEKYLDGSLKQEELNEFLNTHKDLLEKYPNFWSDFTSGADLSKYRIGEIVNLYSDYNANLISIRKQIALASGTEKEALIVQEKALLALMEYNGELARGKDVLKNYNMLLEQYNRLLKYGVEATNLQILGTQALYDYTRQQMSLSEQSINNHISAFPELLGQ